MNRKDVPKATLERYPLYLKALRKLKSDGIDRIMSNELGKTLAIKATTIRRDFSFLGQLGKQGYGYDVEALINIFNDELGITYDEKIILIGAGNLGKALMNYNNWNNVVGEIVCAFDIDDAKVGGSIDIPVYNMKDLETKIPPKCRIAILTVSMDVQETVNRLIKCGIKGIVDFTHQHIEVPKGVKVRHVDVVTSIQELVFQTNAME